MKLESNNIIISDNTANPAPLGLLAFGMTTILLNLHNINLFPLTSMILAMGLFYGGSAQVVAGIMEWKKNNTFGTTAFISYGFFWLALVGLLVLPKLGMAQAAEPASLAAFLGMWGLFTLVMFFATLRLNRQLQFVFGSLTLLFFLLSIGNAIGSVSVLQFAGWVGLICGASAMYSAFAQIFSGLKQVKAK